MGMGRPEERSRRPDRGRQALRIPQRRKVAPRLSVGIDVSASRRAPPRMNMELSEEHRAFRDMVERYVAAEMPKDWARNLEKDEDHYPFELWDKFSAAGFHGIGIDEKYGGMGGDIIMQVLLARALARP